MELIRPKMRPGTKEGAQAQRVIAYFITYRTYASWLHGNPTGSTTIDRNQPGAPRHGANPRWLRQEQRRLKYRPVLLEAAERVVCTRAIQEVCRYRRWNLWAVNVRTNHVHVVVTAMATPERVMNDFKAYSTRALRADDLVEQDTRVWARHGSTRYLWTPGSVLRACKYVIEEQGARQGEGEPPMG